MFTASSVALRVASHSHLSKHFRSYEERLGIIGFTAMLLFAMTHSLWAHEFKVGTLHIEHPWSRATPAGAQVAAGYVTIHNTGSEPDRLVSASGAIAGRTEIHEMAVDDKGVMTMRALPDGVEIPAGGEAALKPGSIHIMFMNLLEPAKEGAPFKGALVFEKAGTVEVEFAVEAMGGSAGHQGHGG